MSNKDSVFIVVDNRFGVVFASCSFDETVADLHRRVLTEAACTTLGNPGSFRIKSVKLSSQDTLISPTEDKGGEDTALHDDHATAIARDVHLGRSGREIRDEIIAQVGMMAAARTPEMQARYDAAVERERDPRGTKEAPLNLMDPIDVSKFPLAAVLERIRTVVHSRWLTSPTFSVEIANSVPSAHTSTFTWRGLTETQLVVLYVWTEAHRGLTVEGGPIPTTSGVIAGAIDVALRVLDDPRLDLTCLSDYRAVLVEHAETSPQESVRDAVRALLTVMNAQMH